MEAARADAGSERLRIVLVTPEYPPAAHAGGIATYTKTTAASLAATGHAVRVVTPAQRTEVRMEDGVEVMRIHHRWVPEPHAERLVRAIRTARASLAFEPDVIQSVEWEANAWWLARRARVPVVTRLATPTYLVERLNRGAPTSETQFLRRLERDQAQRSAALYAPTRAIAEQVGADWEISRDRFRVIPNPLDVDGVQRSAARTPPPGGLPDSPIVFIGRLERRKGLAELGEALGEVLTRHADQHAVLIGRDAAQDGGLVMEDFRRRTAAVAERVQVLGELPRDEALAVVARAKIVVLPSLWENFANAALEALALGRPLIASHVGGFGEFLEHDRNAWLVPPGDAQALTSELAARLADEDALQRVGEGALARAQDFRAEQVVHSIVALYEDVLGARRPLGRSIYRRGYRRFFNPDERDDPFRRDYAAKRDAVLAHFAHVPRQRILDVGGGYGRIAGPLSQRHDVTLADISPEMLEEARARWPGLELVEADARKLPLSDASFDSVLALDLTPHLPNIDEALGEFVRVTRARGKVVFDTTNASPWWVPLYPSYVGWRPKRLLLTMRAKGVLPEWRGLVRHHRGKDVEASIANAGLRLRGVDRIGRAPFRKWSLWWTERP